MISLKFLIINFIITFCVADVLKPEPCYAPPQWNSKFSESNQKKNYYIRASSYSYDAIFQRERIIDEIYANDTKEAHDILYLHKQQLKYKLNLKTRECTIEPIARPWRDIHIPYNAQSLGQSYIGSGQLYGAGLLTNEWTGEIYTKNNETLRYILQFTNRYCLPVSAVYMSENSGVTVLRFSDIKLGVCPFAFEIPKECVKEKEV